MLGKTVPVGFQHDVQLLKACCAYNRAAILFYQGLDRNAIVNYSVLFPVLGKLYIAIFLFQVNSPYFSARNSTDDWVIPMPGKNAEFQLVLKSFTAKLKIF